MTDPDIERRARECIVAICAIEPPDAQKSADLIQKALSEVRDQERERAIAEIRGADFPEDLSPNDARGIACAAVRKGT